MHKQRGMTLLSWVLILGLIAFFTLLALRVVPMYQEYFGVRQIMSSMEQEITKNKMSKQQVITMLMRRFNTGYIKNVSQDNITLTRGRNNSHVSKIVIDYEVREPFIRELDLIGHFVIEANAGGESSSKN